MHGLTGGSWKRSQQLPRQLPTLQDAVLAYHAADVEVNRCVQSSDVHVRSLSLLISHSAVTATASSSRSRVSNP
jgi:hypothetical protein